jgi:hypothetical protein
MKIAVVAYVHGNEDLGVSSFPFFIANMEAKKQNKRFIDVDLNRCFPGKLDGNCEEKAAAELLEKLKDFDYVIDIHSTTADTESFVIITKNNAKKLALAVPLNKLVIMEQHIAQNKALIDHVCGISIEFSKKTKPDEVKDIVMETIENLKQRKKIHKQVYSVYGTKKTNKNIHLQNFKKTKLDGEIFYPVLFGEKEYDFLCMKAYFFSK